jgi:hypothetical protein
MMFTYLLLSNTETVDWIFLPSLLILLWETIAMEYALQNLEQNFFYDSLQKYEN